VQGESRSIIACWNFRENCRVVVAADLGYNKIRRWVPAGFHQPSWSSYGFAYRFSRRLGSPAWATDHGLQADPRRLSGRGSTLAQITPGRRLMYPRWRHGRSLSRGPQGARLVQPPRDAAPWHQDVPPLPRCRVLLLQFKIFDHFFGWACGPFPRRTGPAGGAGRRGPGGLGGQNNSKTHATKNQVIA